MQQQSTTDDVALLAAKGAGEAISTKRILIASLVAPGHEWDILQGMRDEHVEEQVNALGLEGIRKSKDSVTATEISRTPSQSTTGTAESSTTGSLETAASSLQSAPASDIVNQDQNQDPRSASHNLYITACSSSNDLHLEKRNAEALRRYHALMELVETEKGYADDLATLVRVFFQNLTTQAFFDENDARTNAVCRNAGELLDLHNVLAHKLRSVIEDSNLSSEADGTDMDKALRCEEAIVSVAQGLTRMAPRFDVYQLFCSRHAEALILIREAEKRHNGDDFAAFERMCGNLLRGQHRNRSAPSSRRSSAGTSTPTGITSLSLAVADEPGSMPPSGTNTPSGSFASLSRQTSGRLLFADYLIKPIQRLCLYPLVLNSLLKYTSQEEIATRQALESAISAMRKIADDVDRASKQREKDLMAELIVSKVEPYQGITHALLKSFGNPLLSGSLDVLYHHDVYSPLTAPLRFQRLGLVLWHGFLLVVRVRKNQQLECKHWLPLARVRLAALNAEAASPGTESVLWAPTISQPSRPVVPNALRLSYYGHHFELSAGSERECQIWHSRLSQAIQEAPSVLQAFPCSLAEDLGMLRTPASESLHKFFANSVLPNATIPDFLIKFPTASSRSSIDRNMIFSDDLLSHSGFSTATTNSGGGYGPVALSPKDISETLLAQQLRQSVTPSIGSAVGAAMGLARMAATQMPTAVKRVRRQSMLNLTEINPACDALLVDSSPVVAGQASGLPSPGTRQAGASGSIRNSISIDGGEGSSSKWKSTLLRRNSRAMSAKSNAGSLNSSPMTSVADLSHTVGCASPVEDYGMASVAGTAPAMPAHLRSKSMSIRDVWQNSIGRRSRSHSSSSEKGIPGANHFFSPSSNGTSLTSSPVLEQSEILLGSRRGSDIRTGSQLDAIFASTEGDTAQKAGSVDSTGFSSVAQLRRILSASSGHASSRRSKTSDGGRYFGSGASSSGSARAGVERSQTELDLPLVSSLQLQDGQERRRSEPEHLPLRPQLHLETGSQPRVSRPSFTLNAKHSFRRLRLRASQTPSGSATPSPVSSINFASSWGDHSRLNSVEENMAAEVIESGNGSKDGGAERPARPRPSRTPSSSEK